MDGITIAVATGLIGGALGAYGAGVYRRFRWRDAVGAEVEVPAGNLNLWCRRMIRFVDPKSVNNTDVAEIRELLSRFGPRSIALMFWIEFFKLCRMERDSFKS